MNALRIILKEFPYGLWLLYGQRRYRRYIILPFLFSFAVFILLVCCAFGYLDTVADRFLEDNAALCFTARLLGFLIVPVMAAFLSFLVQISFASFLYDFLLEKLMHDHSEHELTFLKLNGIHQIIKGLVDLLLRTSLVIFATISALFLSISWVGVPLAALIGFYILAFEIVDLPLALTGLGFRQRLWLFISHPVSMLLFGAILASILILPLAGILLLPAGYFVAIKLINNWDFS